MKPFHEKQIYKTKFNVFAHIFAGKCTGNNICKADEIQQSFAK
jgi:hypothetical protein